MRLLLFISIIFYLSPHTCNAQNRLNSRLFFLKPSLYFSKSKIDTLQLKGYYVTVSLPKDRRSLHYGDSVYKKYKVEPLNEFFQLPTMDEIHRKMLYDIRSFNASTYKQPGLKHLEIQTYVDIFYPDVRGFLWMKSFAKVKLQIITVIDGIEIQNRQYESFYITDGTDKEFEGNLLMTIEQGANVTIGMALRKALDNYYAHLSNALPK